MKKEKKYHAEDTFSKAEEPVVPFENAEQDFWETLSEKTKTDILEGIDQLNNGERIPYEEVMKKFRK